MKKLIRNLAISIAMLAGVVSPVVVGADMAAAAPTSKNAQKVCQGVKGVSGSSTCDDSQLGDFLKNIVNILLFVIGTASVIMIIIGGLRYVLSNGDSNAVNGAKNTILYSVIGLVVAIMAYAIVNFVLGSF